MQNSIIKRPNSLIKNKTKQLLHLYKFIKYNTIKYIRIIKNIKNIKNIYKHMVKLHLLNAISSEINKLKYN